jgi:hypothetical protein
MFANRQSLLCAFAALALLASAPVAAKEAPKAAPKAVAPMKLKFSGAEYVHRWSKAGQNEFTPTVQTDLKAWVDMVTIVVNEKVVNGDQLATLANNVVGNYDKAGEIIRTDSKPRTDHVEAEHFIAALLPANGVSEAVFARVFLHEGKGVVVVYSHRAYGERSANTIGSFMDHNGEATERALMSWQGMPKLAQLRALPQAK